MYNNPYINTYNPQPSIDRINNQMAELERMKQQLQQQTIQQPQMQPITQNFQLAPTNRDVIRYASSMEEVQRDMVIGDTPYFSKDMSVVWVKNTKGDIKTYELNEVVLKDEKDLLIESLQMQIEQMKGKQNNEQYYSNDDTTKISTNSTTNDKPIRTTTENVEPTIIQKVSRSKK